MPSLLHSITYYITYLELNQLKIEIENGTKVLKGGKEKVTESYRYSVYC